MLSSLDHYYLNDHY